MGMVRLELTRLVEGQRILSPQRLPIPPHPLAWFAEKMFSQQRLIYHTVYLVSCNT